MEKQKKYRSSVLKDTFWIRTHNTNGIIHMVLWNLLEVNSWFYRGCSHIFWMILYKILNLNRKEIPTLAHFI